MSASMNVIIQVPIQAPVMRRELASKLYSPTAYFLGRFISNMLIQLAYPLIMVLIVFWALGIDTSQKNFWELLLFSFIGNMVCCGQGYAIGTLVDDEDASKICNFLIIMILLGTGGSIANIKNANWFVSSLSKISPSRLHCEALMRSLTNQVDDHTEEFQKFEIFTHQSMSQETILDSFGYDYGDSKCFWGLVGWLVGWVVVALIGINIRFRKI